jgi:hypothetical protein
MPGGGSLGVPGVVGGISGGSIGIDDNRSRAAMFLRPRRWNYPGV